MIKFFTEPLSEGWIYPCSLEDVKISLDSVPPKDIEGISAIGLCNSTNRDQYANARYFFGANASIRIYSWKSDLNLRLPAHINQQDAFRYLDKEIEYGMQIAVDGKRIICHWGLNDLKKFILNHVLIHEIGHHVYYKSRIAAGLKYEPFTNEAEKFAESFARRYQRNRS